MSAREKQGIENKRRKEPSENKDRDKKTDNVMGADLRKGKGDYD